MKKCFKKVIATTIMLAVTSVLAFAQVSNWTSGYTIQDDVDLATNYKFYKDAKVKDFIVSTWLNSSNINVDFAKQFKSVYLGLSYNGNFWGHDTINVSKNENNKSTNTNTKSDFENNLSGFIGLDNNMAVGFYIYTKSDFSSTKSEAQNSSTVKTKDNSTDLTIGANWTGDFDTSKFLLKPYVSASYETKIKDNDPKQEYNKINNINLNLGADFVNGSRDELYSDIYVSYGLALNDKKSYDPTDKKIGSTSDFNNELSFAYKTSYKFNDKLTFGGKVNATMHFDFNKVLSSNGDLTNSSFVFQLNPSISAGAKYAFVPSKFSLTTGIAMNLPNVNVITKNNELTKTVTTTTNFNKDTNSNKRYFGIGLNVGFDWNITDNLVLDMGTYVPLNSNNTLFRNMSIGISYRK